MSRDLVEEILNRSPQMESVNFPHPKWIIIAQEMGARIKSVETHNVLTFETPEQFKTQVSERVGKDKFEKATEKEEGEIRRSQLQGRDLEENYSLLQQAFMATLGVESIKSPREWDLRFGTERQYLTLLQNHLDIFGFNDEQKVKLQHELQGSLLQLEGRQKAILEALAKSPEDISKMISERAERVVNRFGGGKPEGK